VTLSVDFGGLLEAAPRSTAPRPRGKPPSSFGPTPELAAPWRQIGGVPSNPMWLAGESTIKGMRPCENNLLMADFPLPHVIT